MFFLRLTGDRKKVIKRIYRITNNIYILLFKIHRVIKNNPQGKFMKRKPFFS
jgi:hypothetical protein